MIRFSPDFHENFLAVVRKYMQIRGGMTQKDLSEQMNVGISTMSRFLNLKTSNVDEQLVANIIATLGIPLHEIIDGVEEESTETFKRLVQFYKDQRTSDEIPEEPAQTKKPTTGTINVGSKTVEMSFGNDGTRPLNPTSTSIGDKLKTLTPRQRGYLNDFLNLDTNDRDLIVDLGDAIFRYIKQRNIHF